MSALGSKRTVLLLGAVAILTLVAGGMRTWVTGSTNDAVLGSSQVTATGSQAVPGLVALALAAGAAIIATLTAGPVARRITTALLALCALGLGGMIARVIAAPSDVLGGVAARASGRTGSIETHAQAGAWPWIGLAACALLLLAALGAGIGAPRWAGLGSRYDAPQGGDARGARGERTSSTWDRLSAGEDPTADEQPPGGS